MMVNTYLYYSNNKINIEIFLYNNVTLIINPIVNPIKTIYVPYNDWIEIKNNNTHQRYSYMEGEYQVKDYISIDNIVGIITPKELEDDIKKLLNKYKLSIPIYINKTYFNDINYNINNKIL